MRLLFVSIAMPPKNDPESLQTAKYLKYLSKKFDVDIVTSKPNTLWMNNDESLAHYLKNVNQIIEIPIFEPKYLSIISNKFFRNFLKPDSRFSFHLQSNTVIKNIKQKPDIIYSRAFPLSSVIMAKKLKTHFQVPWILHLSDPWTESPLFNFNNSKYHKTQEQECFELADKITFTSNKTIEIYKNKYPHLSDKFQVLPNVFDESDKVYSSNKLSLKNNKINLVYTGSLNGNRSFKTISKAIDLLKKENDKTLLNIKFTIAGSVDSYNAKLLENHQDLIEFVGFLNKNEVLKLQNSADILIAIDFDFKDAKDAIFFPSKLLDYFITEKPILAITNKNSTTDVILKELNHKIIYHKDVNSMVDFIKNIKSVLNQRFETPKGFSAKENVNKLTKLIEEICQK